MESNNLNQISVDIPNYSGPLEVVPGLDHAGTSKPVFYYYFAYHSSYVGSSTSILCSGVRREGLCRVHLST